ncbi:OmpA family protein [Alienimonas sp. DA493]|uniref:OmpA family protein n=1 Tax=Alienimonas sp. DA493 TaxID=3373605 RepID=UPI0037544B8A
MTKGRILAVCLIWLGIVGLGAVAWKVLVAPARERAAAEALAERQRLQEEAEARQRAERIRATRDPSRYDASVTLALDSFSGYAALRSDRFRQELADRGVRLTLKDDGADYAARLAALADGTAPVAAFTVDALLKHSHLRGDSPAVIVAVLDESRGGDAILAYRDAVPSLDALNDPAARFVLVPDSPSETLARVAMARFDLSDLPPDPFEPVADAAEVFRAYQNSPASAKRAYVAWEPQVSKMLENPAMHRLFDSGVRGYILDVLVVSRDYLRKNPETVRKVLEAYFTANHVFRKDYSALVAADAVAAGEPLTPEQADAVADGVWWHNAAENYARFGLSEDRDARRVQYLEDAVTNIAGVLRRTGATDGDSSGGDAAAFFYSGALKALRDEGFSPGPGEETVRNDVAELPPLPEEGWAGLLPIGELDLPDLSFAPGRSALSNRSERVLDNLAETLADFPTAYVTVRGNAARRGDPEANRLLAEARAQAAVEYLVRAGVSPNRLRAEGGEPSGSRTVSVLVGRPAY